MAQTTFPLGVVEISPNAAEALAQHCLDSESFLARHARGDWGDIDEQQRNRNAESLQNKRSLQSAFALDDQTKLVIVTSQYWAKTRLFLASESTHEEVDVRAGYALWSQIYDKQKNPLVALEAPYVTDILSTLNIKTALDAATGTGRHALNLAAQGVEVTAVDQSAEMLDIARQKAKADGLNIEFKLAALEDGLPFLTKWFDLVLCALALSHISELTPVFHTFYRLLCPGGYLLITDFHPEIIEFGWRTSFHAPGIKYTLPKIQHTRQVYLDSAKEAGFTLLSVQDLPVKMVPEGYLFQEHIEAAGEQNLCLVLLVQKGVH